MSENSWVLRGVDPETRQLAIEEAERLGLSLSDYLTTVLMQGGEEPAPEDELHNIDFSAPPETPRENFAFRHRLEALERRLGLSIGGLDSAVHALDTSVYGLASRLDETEALAANTADTVDHAFADLGGNVGALRKRLVDAEENLEALSETLDLARNDFSQENNKLADRLDDVGHVARNAQASAAALHAAQDALQRALAQDFNDFTDDHTLRLESAFGDLRAIADNAARHADEAVARALDALRQTREAVEQNLADSQAESRARMHAAFSDAAERLGALAEHVIENERAIARSAEQLTARIIDVEDAGQIALEETAEGLRRADAAIAAEITRVAQAGQISLDATRNEIDSAIAELSERQLGGLARLKLVDAALSSTIDDLANFRDNVDTRLASAAETARQRQASAEAAWDERIAALYQRLDDADQSVRLIDERQSAELARVDETHSAEIARVEACTFAALEKLSRDIAAGDAALSQDLTDAREQQSGALARLRLIDKALDAQELVAACETGAAPVAARLAHLERAVRAADTGQALQALVMRVGAIASELEALRQAGAAEKLSALAGQVQAIAAAQTDDEAVTQRLEDLRTRLVSQETQAGETADRVHGVARMLGRLTAQNADAATQSEDRLHKLELALADLRLESYSGGEAAPSSALAALNQRIDDMDQRQADAFENLRADITHFIGENDRRLAALEQGGIATLSGDDVLIGHAIEARLTTLEQRDVTGEFEALRRRIEDRVLNVESRSVRALEQVSETVALIEKRISVQDEAAREARSA